MGREPTASRRGDQRILLIDDDQSLARLMREFFDENGWDLEAAHDGTRGLARALAGPHDLILLDVTMPGLDGFEVLRQIRKRSAVPVIMLTARTALEDRVTGLEEGADDYLPKPFGPKELVARIRAVLRRAGREGTAVRPDIEIGPVRLSPGRREVHCGTHRIDVTSIEFEILELLMRAAGRVVTHQELSAVLYQRPFSPLFDRSTYVHVSHLRRKLGKEGGRIETVRSAGYQFRKGPE